MKTPIFLLALWLSLSAQAEIREAQTMKEALQTVDKETLLIFDLDNTLVEPAQSLGSDQWFEHTISRFTSEALASGKTAEAAKPLALEKALGLWKAVQRVTRVQLVEADTAELIARAQNSGTPTLGLTARPIDLADATLAQLKSVNISLAKHSVPFKKLTLKESTDPNFQAVLRDGVLFSGNNPKGGMLVKLLGTLKQKPKKIVFVDDRKHNIESVEAALDKGTIPHLSYRYGAADEKVKRFDSRITDVQELYFQKILSDDAASKLVISR